MLVGNKCDESAALREVTELEGKAEAASWGVSFMGTFHNHTQYLLLQIVQYLDAKNKKKKTNKIEKIQ